MSMPTPDPLYAIADELRTIADMGLRSTGATYDRQPYERLLPLGAPPVAAEAPGGQCDCVPDTVDARIHLPHLPQFIE